MNLNLVVFESEQKITELITIRLFRELVGLGIVDTPIPVVVTSLLSPVFKIITYPPKVKLVARYGELNRLKFSRVYGIAQTKLFDLLPDPGEWCRLGLLLEDIDRIGRWLNWGLNWGVLDKADIDSYIKNNVDTIKLLDIVDIEDVLQNLANLKLVNKQRIYEKVVKS